MTILFWDRVNSNPSCSRLATAIWKPSRARMSGPADAPRAAVRTALVTGAGAGRAAYGSSKAAGIALTRQMAIELAPHGVTANAIAPGPTETDMVRRHHTAEARASYEKAIPAARYATPDEIADATAYLCSASAAYINGAVLPVDGGFLAAGIL